PFIPTTHLRYLGAYTVPRAYIQSETVTHEMLKTLTGNQVFMRNRRNVSPQNNTEAIALADNNYNINLFYAANPLREYFEIRSYPGDLGGRYTPSDIDMKHIYNKNPNLIKLTTFDPRIPSNFYNNTILCSAIENEGYTRQELSSEDPYELLQIAFLSETFHAGWYPNISNTNTPFLYLDVDELSTNDILCFGCRSDELIALTFSEVAGMFRSSGNFINNIREPSGGFLSNLSIRKLRKICLSSSSPAARDCIREI